MKVSDFTEIKLKKIKKETIIHYPEVREFCTREYPNHPNGCPNILYCRKVRENERLYFDELAEGYKHFYFLYAEVDFEGYKKWREKQNPEFFLSDARKRCLLYWQASVRKQLYDKAKELQTVNEMCFLGCGKGRSMENAGINVFSTMRLNDIKFEIKPKTKVVLCTLICSMDKLKIPKQKRVDEF